MQERNSVVNRTREKRLVVKQAMSNHEIEAALKLRFEVFNLEMNEGLQTSYRTGLDRDEYDTICDHIIVLDEAKDMVVGTYRMLLGSEAEKSVGYYSENEFEMSSFRRLAGEKLELGRACVHHDYRGTAVLSLMWSGIASHIDEYDVDYIFGCGSIHTINPTVINSIYGYFKAKYMADDIFRVTPLKRVPGFDAASIPDRRLISQHLPPLLSTYLRLGAQIAGEPAFDDQFGVADFLVLLDREKLLSRYKARFF